MKVVVIPVGVTRESVEGLLRELLPTDLVVAVTLPGFEDVKRSILEALRGIAVLVGAEYREIVVSLGETEPLVDLYRLLLSKRPDIVYLVGLTGSRFLLPSLSAVLLKYWRDTGNRVVIMHGLEGDGYSLEPLPGFCVAGMKLTDVQRRLLDIVYGSSEAVSGKVLIERYGFTRSVYAVLRDLERKGLLVVRKGRIEGTYPGRLFYSLLKASEEV